MTGQNGQKSRAVSREVPPARAGQLAGGRLAARAVGAPQVHLFTTLGYRRYLFWTFAIYTGRLLHGRRGVDTELLILGHPRSCEYELQHRRMARRRNWAANTNTIFAWPAFGTDREVLSSARQQALLQALPMN